MDVVVDGFEFCSLECARMHQLCERLKKIEGVLIELKYEVKKSNQVGGWETGRD
jgi:hypothetical protein